MKHNLAYVDPGAVIGENVVIDPFSVIHDDVVIGDGTWIGSNVTIFEGTRIGKNCKVFPGAVLGAIPQDLKFKGEKTTTEIGDHTTIRECVTIHRGTIDKMKTTVGSNCLLMAYVHVAHDCVLGDHIIIANSVNLAGHVVIEDYAILEGLVAVQQFIRIGMHSFITGSSLVRKNIPPYVKVAREPLQYIGINAVGMRRRGFSDASVLQIEDLYRLLFVRGHSVSNALPLIEKEIPDSREKTLILNFIRSSEDGIIRGISK